MKATILILLILAFAGGVFVASNFDLVPKAASQQPVDEERVNEVVAEEEAKVAEASLEDRLVKAFKNLWSFRIEDGRLYLTLNVPPETKVEGCNFVAYGFEVYSVAAVTAGPGRVYHGGGFRVDGQHGISSESPWDLKHLRKMLAVPDDTQRALVVKFWVGPDRDSKIRYLVGERLWDGSW